MRARSCVCARAWCNLASCIHASTKIAQVIIIAEILVGGVLFVGFANIAADVTPSNGPRTRHKAPGVVITASTRDRAG